MKYRKKPVVIEAVQFNGRNSADIHEFCGDKVREPVGKDYLEIKTLEGIHIASPGDYIIKGVNGEFYPCKPDIFEKTYEKEETKMSKTIYKEVLDIIEEIVDKDTLWRIMNNLRKKVILLSMEDDRDTLMKIKEVLEMAIKKEE